LRKGCHGSLRQGLQGRRGSLKGGVSNGAVKGLGKWQGRGGWKGWGLGERSEEPEGTVKRDTSVEFDKGRWEGARKSEAQE